MLPRIYHPKIPVGWVDDVSYIYHPNIPVGWMSNFSVSVDAPWLTVGGLHHAVKKHHAACFRNFSRCLYESPFRSPRSCLGKPHSKRVGSLPKFFPVDPQCFLNGTTLPPYKFPTWCSFAPPPPGGGVPILRPVPVFRARGRRRKRQ